MECLLKKSETKPDKYVSLPYSVGTMTIDGREWVMGCPCNGARRFQNVIDNHASQIAHYLNKTSEELRNKSEAIKVKT